MKHRAITILSVLLLAVHTVSAQNGAVIIPPSPTAASLAEYADVPVSLYTGLPNVNIPLWTLSGKHLQLPLSLSYHGGGVKVEENSSWIGLGFSLNAGGVISRTVRGLPDEDTYGYINESSIPDQPVYTTELEFVVKKEADYEPDIFFFNFNGHSGKFVYNKNQDKFIPLSESDLGISYKGTASSITSFEVQTADGTVYTFGRTEQTRMKTTFWQPVSLQGSETPKIRESLSVATTSWYLTSITTPAHKETITLSYTTERYQYRGSRLGRNGYRVNGNKAYETQTQTTYEIVGARLTTIAAPFLNTRVDFVAGEDRQDVKQFNAEPQSAKRLAKIQVVNTVSSKVTQTFVLDNDQYFTNSKINQVVKEDQYLYRRLKLVGVQEWDGNQAQAKPSYQFTYDERSALPPKDAHTQDHWGYFNGTFKGGGYYSSNYMIPPYKGRVDNVEDRLTVLCNNSYEEYPLNILDYVALKGDNREPLYPAMQAGTLTKIQYPTGGTTTFTYEPHEYSYVGNVDYEIIRNPLGNFMAEVGKYEAGGSDKTDRSESFIPAQVNKRNQVIPIYFELEQLFAVLDEHEDLPEEAEAVTKNEFALREAATNKVIYRMYMDFDGARWGVYTQRYDKTNNRYITTRIEPTYVEPDVREDITVFTALYQSSIQDPVLIELEAGTAYVLDAKRLLDNDIDFRNYTITNQAAVLVSMDNIALQGNEEIITNHMAGGLRLQQQTIADGNTAPLTIRYSYHQRDATTDQETDQSSGALLSLPTHHYERFFEDRTGGAFCEEEGCALLGGKGGSCYEMTTYAYTVLEGNASYTVPLSTTQGSFIGYDQVKEVREGNGFTWYYYHSPVDHEDRFPTTVYHAATQVISGSTNQTRDSDILIEHHIGSDERIQEYLSPFIARHSVDWKRGLLDLRVDYHENGTELKREDNRYALVNQTKSKGIALFANDILSSVGGQSSRWAEYTKYDIIGGFQKLEEKTVVVPDQSTKTRKVTTATAYRYNEPTHHQLASETMTDSEGRTQTTSYKYAPDFTTPAYGSNLLRAKHMHSQVLEQTTQVKTGTQTPLTAQKVTTTYSSVSNHVVPTQMTNYPTGTTEAENTNLEYDSYGNIKQVTGVDGIPTAYLWGYNHTLPVAQVVGATYGEAVAKVNLTSLQTMNDGALRTELGKLRTLSKGHVITYTHDPLVGVTSQTDPDGRVNTYQYDALNRLQWIKSFDPLQQEGHVVQKFDYQYAQP